MATTAPLWKTVGVFLADPHTPCHPQANHSQSQGCRGEVPVESQHLIGDGLSDWMTEEVDFSSYLPTPHSSPSPNSSPPPSPLQNDIQVPSDLEVMTSLLQEELAQLEDYFLSEPLPEKGAKLGKCDKGPPPACPQSYYQLPYASYPTSNQSEAQPSPLLVTLATGELDLLSFCGGPNGRSKPPRPVPYSCGRPSGCARKRVPDGARLGEVFENTSWSSKGNISGSPPVSLHGSPGGGEDERAAGRGYCPGSAVEIRRCAVLPKDDKHCHFTEGIVGGGKGVGCGYGFGAPLDVPHKRDDLLMYGMREIGDIGPGGEMELLSHVKPGVDMGKAGMPWKTESGDGYLQSAPPAYQSLFGPVNEQVKGESLQLARHHDFHCGYLEDQGSGCLPVDRDGLDLGSPNHRHLRGLKDDSCSVKSELESIPEFPQGERKQKKRDQNKTAAHRYRQRKRAELDSLEEQLHGLEGRNRELRDKAESVEREIQYVKDLLIEVYKARSQRLKQDHNG